MKNGAQLLVTGSGKLQTDQINDDGRGFVYIGPNTEVELETHLESCTHVYHGGKLAISNNGTTKFMIKRHLDVYGIFAVGYPMELYYGQNVGNFTMRGSSTPKNLKFRSVTVSKSSGLILETDDSQTPWTIELDADKNLEFGENSFFVASKLDSIGAKKLNFLANSKILINQGLALNASLFTEDVYLDCTSDLGLVNFASNLQKFVVGSSGDVKLITSLLSLKTFTSNGSLTFLDNIHVIAETFSIGPIGKVIFANTSVPTILQVHTLTVNGFFNPGKLSTGDGWQLLSVGPDGYFTFTTNHTVIIDTLIVAGKLQINGSINLQKRDMSGKSLINIAQGGSFLLDDFIPCTNRTKYSGTSEILALNVTINGIFHAGRINIGPGWDNLIIGPKGDFAFIPGSHVKVNRVTIGGKFRTDTKVVMKSKSAVSEEIEIFHINDGGSVELNCSPVIGNVVINASKNATTIQKNYASQIFATDVRIDGTFKARKLYMGLGWTRLTIGSKGSLNVHPIGWFSFDVFSVYGTLVSISDLEIEGKSTVKLPLLHIGTSGHLKCTENKTDILVDAMLVEGRFETGLLAIGSGMTKLNVSGVMTFNHIKQFLINTTIIGGTLETWTPFTSSGKFMGQDLTVTGTMKVNYQGTPQQENGLTPSVFVVNRVQFIGSVYFGSLHLTSDDVTVSGLLSADYGGALANKGPGIEINRTFPSYCISFWLFLDL